MKSGCSAAQHRQISYLSGKSLSVEEVLGSLGVLASKMEAHLLQPVAVAQRAAGDVDQVGFVGPQGHVLAGVIHGAPHLEEKKEIQKTFTNMHLRRTRSLWTSWIVWLTSTGARRGGQRLWIGLARVCAINRGSGESDRTFDLLLVDVMAWYRARI